jgi:CheY-like chemotaxis protein
MSNILWFDNDPALLGPYADELRRAGNEVKQVASVAAAEAAIKAEDFDLLILDVMIPTKSDDEEVEYPPSETDYGHKTGLVLYRKKREHLKRVGTRVLVLSVRLDSGIFDEFKKAGLHKDNFATKVSVREADDFIAKVDEVLGRDA